MAVKTTNTETGIGVENWGHDFSAHPYKECTSHTACFSQNLTINMPAATAPTTQTPIITPLPMSGGAPGTPSSPTIPISTTPQLTPAPPGPPASMAAGVLGPLSFSPPVHPATPSGLSMLMPEPNADLRVAMNGANSASKAPVRARMPAPGAAKIGMKPVSESKPKASESKRNISLPCKVTSVYMCADKAEVAEGEEEKIW
eukprot:287581-Rhodomonas_salina.1